VISNIIQKDIFNKLIEDATQECKRSLQIRQILLIRTIIQRTSNLVLTRLKNPLSRHLPILLAIEPFRDSRAILIINFYEFMNKHGESLLDMWKYFYEFIKIEKILEDYKKICP